jgi:hypothetical protein
VASLWMKLYYLVTIPISLVFILQSARIHPTGRAGGRELHLGFAWSATSTAYRRGAAIKPRSSWPSNCLNCLQTCLELSLSAALGRVGPPRVCRSRAVLPAVHWSSTILSKASLLETRWTREAGNYQSGDYSGTLDEVKANIARHGDIACCECVKG